MLVEKGPVSPAMDKKCLCCHSYVLVLEQATRLKKNNEYSREASCSANPLMFLSSQPRLSNINVPESACFFYKTVYSTKLY